MYARRRRRHFGAVEETVSRSEHLVTDKYEQKLAMTRQMEAR